MIELDDMDAEAIVVDAELTERALMTATGEELAQRLHPSLITPLWRRWVGSPRAIEVRWYRVVGRAAVSPLADLNSVLGGHENLIEERLRVARIVAGPEPHGGSQFQLAQRVYVASFELDLAANAERHGIRRQDAALYRRRFARHLAELEISGGGEESESRWESTWAVTLPAMKCLWSPSPAGYWRLLEGSRG